MRNVKCLQWMERYTHIRHLVTTHIDTVIGVPKSIRSGLRTVTILHDYNGTLPVHSRCTMLKRMERFNLSLVRIGVRPTDLGWDTVDYPPEVCEVSMPVDNVIKNEQTGSLIIDTGSYHPSINCPNIEVIASSIPLGELACPRLVMLEVPTLLDLSSMVLPSLRMLWLEDVNSDKDLYSLVRSTPSLETLRMTDLTLTAVATHYLPRSLTSLDLEGPIQSLVILSPCLKLQILLLDGSYNRTGPLPPTLVALKVGKLAMCELTQCPHLRNLSYSAVMDEDEWPLSITELSVRLDGRFTLPAKLPPRLRSLIIELAGYRYPCPVSYPLSNLNRVAINIQLSPEQLNQFRGRVLICSNPEEELKEMQRKLPYSTLWSI